MTVTNYCASAIVPPTSWGAIGTIGADPNAGPSAAHEIVSVKDTDQTQGTTAADVTEMTVALKSGATYVFDYNIIYSTSGLLVGAQFAIDFTGTVTSVGYSILMSNTDDSMHSDSTTTDGTFLGTGASLVGGGPKYAKLSGSIKTGGTGNLMLRLKATGVSTSVTLKANTNCIIREV